MPWDVGTALHTQSAPTPTPRGQSRKNENSRDFHSSRQQRHFLENASRFERKCDGAEKRGRVSKKGAGCRVERTRTRFQGKNVNCKNVLRVNEGSAFSNERVDILRTARASATRTSASSGGEHDENDAVAKHTGRNASQITRQLDPYGAVGRLRDKCVESGPVEIEFDSSQEKTVPVKSRWTRTGRWRCDSNAQ